MGRTAGVVVLALALSGCFLKRANDNTKVIKTLGSIRGSLSGQTPGSDAFVVLFFKRDGTWVRFSHRLFAKPGPFEFSCIPGMKYRVVAFEDTNHDLALSPGERAAMFGADDGVEMIEGQSLDRVDLDLVPIDPLPRFAVSANDEGTVAEELVRVHRGDLCTLDEPRFDPEAGELGLWQPVDFALKYGVGVSFLEPYDPKRIPVLFVHGAAGSSRDFETLIAHLDRAKFQPWVFSYPSGIRIGLASATLKRLTDDLQHKLGFPKLYVVAHSMGGLVARDYVTQVVQSSPSVYVALLLTMSTPWDGVESAKTGIESSPVVMPSWIDVAQGSAFLRVLTEKPLPPEIPYYLFFSFEGGNGSDGTIALKSQLLDNAQKGAKEVVGFPEDHTSILKSAAVSDKLNAVLAGR